MFETLGQIDIYQIPLVDAVSQFIDTGGPVLWVILAVSLLLWTLILERYWFLKVTYKHRVSRWGSEWQDRIDRRSWFARRIRSAMLSEAKIELNSTLPLISTLIAMCPLLGLLGTVTGMIQVFDVMSLKGTSDVRAMSAGVAAATVPTMAGMVIALSGLWFHSRLQQLQRREAERLADQLGDGRGDSL